MTTVNPPTRPAQIRLTRRSPAYGRVTIDNPPINVMGPEMVPSPLNSSAAATKSRTDTPK